MNYVFSKDLLAYCIMSIILTIFAGSVFIISKQSILIPIIIVGIITSVSCYIAYASLRKEETEYNNTHKRIKICSKCDNMISIKDNEELGHAYKCLELYHDT